VIVSDGQSNVLSSSTVPFARSRFLAFCGTVVFGLAGSMMRPRVIRAYHQGPIPPGCFGFNPCHCCNGDTCCESGCNWPAGHWEGCPGGGQCWYACVSCQLYRCCDWHDSAGNHCLCRGWVRCGGCDGCTPCS
jgi:hypothetical protein